MLHFIFQKPTQARIDKCVEIYHKYSTKGITLEMLKECREETGLGLSEIKICLEDYIRNTYENN